VETGSPHRERAESAERQLELLIGSVRDYAIFSLDAEGRVKTWNRGAELIKGYTPDEIIGRHIDAFYTPEDRAMHRPELLLGLARKNGRVEDQGWRVRKDGTRFWADVVITAVHDDDGALLGYVKVTRDLTDRRAAEEELRQGEQRLRLLIESVKDYAIFMLDLDGRVTTWNIGAQRILGYRTDEVIGANVAIFSPEERRKGDFCDQELAIALRDGRFEHHGWRVRKDGTQFWADVIITPMHDSTGRHVGFAMVTRDLTEQRRSEDERVRLSEAQASIRMRDEFLSIAAHELRTPLTALQLQLDTIRRAEGASPRIERAARSTTRLADLVESLLDVSRIATGRMPFRWEKSDLAALVRDVGDGMLDTAHRSGCALQVTVPPVLETCCDPLRVQQVLTNLLANAIKYGVGKPIDVTLRAERGDAVLDVRDHGAGVPDADRARIFERFERAVPMRNYGGLGLGLYVAREIVAAHGGTIAVADAAGGGACFTVTFPIRQTAP